VNKKTNQLIRLIKSEIPKEGWSARLCFVNEGVAWFTTCQPFEKQWGDDWNDTPWEYNAGVPYAWNDCRGVNQYNLYAVKFSGQFEYNYNNYLNSPWSVEEINKGASPWLLVKDDNHQLLDSIYAKTTLSEFVKKVIEYGGICRLWLS
jgi:hypothetical protein